MASVIRRISLCALFVMISGVVTATVVQSTEFLRVGVVGSLKSMGDDSTSFEFKGKGVGKLNVQLSDETKYVRVSAKPLKDIEDGTSLQILAIEQPAQPNMGPALSRILAIVSGEFEPPQIPEKTAKILGMKWHTGNLSLDGNAIKLGQLTINGGAARPVSSFETVTRDTLAEIKREKIHIYGDLFKKVKGEKMSRFNAKKVAILNRGVPPKELGFILLEGVEKPKEPLDLGGDGS